ncbi:unnamed protein product [Prunus armeniaca]
MASRRSACKNWLYSVGTRIFKIIEKNKLGSSQYISRLVGEKLHQVSHIYGEEFVVDLRAKTCSCRRWNLYRIPCPHVISTIFQRCENPTAYVDDCYKPQTYMKAYEPVIHPIPSMDHWNKCGLPLIKHPLCKQQPGRPKSVRTKEPCEVEIPALIPSNPRLPNYIAPPAKLQEAIIEQHVMDKTMKTNTLIHLQPKWSKVLLHNLFGAVKKSATSGLELKVRPGFVGGARLAKQLGTVGKKLGLERRSWAIRSLNLAEGFTAGSFRNGAGERPKLLEPCCSRIRCNWASQDVVEKLARSGRNYRKISGISLNVGCCRISLGKNLWVFL